MIIVTLIKDEETFSTICEEISLICTDAVIRQFDDLNILFDYLKSNSPNIFFIDTAFSECALISMRIKNLIPKANIIFISDSTDFAAEALRQHCSGYILKPVKKESILLEINNLRYPIDKSEIPVPPPNRFSRLSKNKSGDIRIF